ncbi:protein phosphatase CheZ [Maritalea porphyrae]|uniref:protein phosphatase CheZ n=2 Tax=Maritalea TaxID=623276 RepID=UPI0022AFC8CB|nr:protein phosphatase CheZ [Maritalea porphyrae]MCZ4271440.1 protein phosphatase CheZ [Maritalea porphyrae]
MNTAEKLDDPVPDHSEELASREDNAIPLREVIAMAEKVTSALKPLVRSLDKSMYRELRDMLNCIEELRGDLSKVDPDDIFSRRIPEMGRELSAIVSATEVATNSIMNIAEQVMDADKSDPEAYAKFVEQHMLAIFEACTFQDLTGQRVTRVIQTVEVIEERIGVLCRMIENNQITPNAPKISETEKRNRARLVKGPANKGEGIDQDAVDAMF